MNKTFTAAPRPRPQRLDLRTSTQFYSSAAKETARQTNEPRRPTFSRHAEVVLVGVPEELTEEKVRVSAFQHFKTTTTVKRILRYPTRLPTSYVSIRFGSSSDADKALQTGLTIDSLHLTAEKPRSRQRRPPPVSRCFNCQKLDNHVSRSCPHPTICPRCAGQHKEAECSATSLKCANCQEEHAAFSNDCPSWKYRQARNIRETTPASQQDARFIRADLANMQEDITVINKNQEKQQELIVKLLQALKNQTHQIAGLRHQLSTLTPTETPRAAEAADQSLDQASCCSEDDLVGDVISTVPPSPEQDTPSACIQDVSYATSEDTSDSTIEDDEEPTEQLWKRLLTPDPRYEYDEDGFIINIIKEKDYSRPKDTRTFAQMHDDLMNNRF